MEYGKYIKYIFITACVIILLYYAPTIINLLLPFLLAIIVASPFHRLVSFLESKMHIRRGVSSFVIFTLIIGVIIGAVGLLVYYLVFQFKSFITIIPDMIESARVTLTSLYEKYRRYIPSIAEFFETHAVSFESYSPILKDSAMNYAKNFAFSIPSFLFSALIFLLSVFFFIKDHDAVKNFFKEALPDKTVAKLRYIKNTAWKGFVGYLKAELILSSITALFVAVTFWILGIDYAVVWAVITGIVDFIPILGSGIVLVPFAIIHFIMNENLFLAICVIVLQIVVFIIRQVLSPRIMSSQLGLHPLITLISLYVGNKLMGIFGMVSFPIFALLIVSLYTAYKNAGSFEKAIEKDIK